MQVTVLAPLCNQNSTPRRRPRIRPPRGYRRLVGRLARLTRIRTLQLAGVPAAIVLALSAAGCGHAPAVEEQSLLRAVSDQLALDSQQRRIEHVVIAGVVVSISRPMIGCNAARRKKAGTAPTLEATYEAGVPDYGSETRRWFAAHQLFSLNAPVTGLFQSARAPS